MGSANDALSINSKFVAIAVRTDSSDLYYAICAVMGAITLCIMLICGHWNIKPARIGLRIRDYNDLVAAALGRDETMIVKKKSHSFHSNASRQQASERTEEIKLLVLDSKQYL